MYYLYYKIIVLNINLSFYIIIYIMSTKNRSFKIYKNEHYAYKNTSCFKSITVKRSKQVKYMLLTINGVAIEPSSTSTDSWTWDFSILRENFRDLFGETQRETELIALENTLTYNGLKAIQHFTLSSAELKGSVFTSNLMIQFIPNNQNQNIFECEEIIYISDQNK